MKTISAGLLMFRKKNIVLEVLLVHPGSPLFKNKDDGYWGLPKGVVHENEDTLDGAKREFEEETGIKPQLMLPSTHFIDLGSVEQKNNKTVYAWAFEGDCDTSKIKSNTFDLEWPPGSGKISVFPEIDRGQFFAITEAKYKMSHAQSSFINRLEHALKFIDSPLRSSE